MHFRILEMIATSGFLTALECTKFDFGRDSTPDPAGESLQRSPDSLAGLRGLLLRGGREGDGKGGEGGEEVGQGQKTGDGGEWVGMLGKGEGKGGRRRGGERGEGRKVRTPPEPIPAYAPDVRAKKSASTPQHRCSIHTIVHI